jgi:hypothetical protein
MLAILAAGGAIQATFFFGELGRFGSIGTGLVLLLLGSFILFRYGLTREPLYFNPFNPRRKPIPVWVARLIYIPLAALFFYGAVRNLVGR